MQTPIKKENKSSSEQIGKNPIAQRIIKAMEKPPYVSSEDIESLLQVIKESKQPTHFESPSKLSSKIR